MRKSSIIILVLLTSSILVSTHCASNPEPVLESTPVPEEIKVISIEEEDTTTDQITQHKTFDQCESASPLKATIRFSESNSRESERELVVGGTVGGEVGVSGAAKVVVEGSIEQHFLNSKASVVGNVEGVDITVPPNTRQEYTIVWQEKIREGTVKYEENGKIKTAKYAYRIGLELVSTKSKDLICPGQDAVDSSSTPTSEVVAAEPSEEPAVEEPTSTMEPTATMKPTESPEPIAQPTPVGMVNEVHQISGEWTNGWKEADPDSWYSTGIYVQTGDRLSIEYVSGEWWVGKVEDGEWVLQVSTDARGYQGRLGEQVVAQFQADDASECFELPSAPIGSLIGRIGESGGQFLVGNSYESVVKETGILFLRMNYNCRRGWVNKLVGKDCPVVSGGNISVRLQVVPSS